MSAASSPEFTRERMGHVPALDGIRGLAVLAVIAHHLGHLRGGYLGVDAFFVLSGFLITGLLVDEVRFGSGGSGSGGGRIDLGRFWTRRVKRLFPALALVVVVVVLVESFIVSDPRASLRREVLSALLYVYNWNALADNIDYWSSFASPSPLQHMWSLAIEEQFYLVWPLVVVAVIWWVRRRAAGRAPNGRPDGVAWIDRSVVAIGVTAAVLAVTSVVIAQIVHDPENLLRVYYGTDTRIRCDPLRRGCGRGDPAAPPALGARSTNRRVRRSGTAGPTRRCVGRPGRHIRCAVPRRAGCHRNRRHPRGHRLRGRPFVAAQPRHVGRPRCGGPGSSATGCTSGTGRSSCGSIRSAPDSTASVCSRCESPSRSASRSRPTSSSSSQSARRRIGKSRSAGFALATLVALIAFTVVAIPAGRDDQPTAGTRSTVPIPPPPTTADDAADVATSAPDVHRHHAPTARTPDGRRRFRGLLPRRIARRVVRRRHHRAATRSGRLWHCRHRWWRLDRRRNVPARSTRLRELAD